MPAPSKKLVPLSVVTLAVLSALALARCGQAETGYLNILAAPDYVLPDGTIIKLTLNGADKSGAPLAGKARMTADCGTLNGADAKQGVDVAMTDGHGEASYWCNAAHFDCCNGTVAVQVSLSGFSDTAAIRIGDVYKAMDAGASPDSGFVNYCDGVSGNVLTYTGDKGTNWYGTTTVSHISGPSASGDATHTFSVSLPGDSADISFDTTALNIPLAPGRYEKADGLAGHASMLVHIHPTVNCGGDTSPGTWFEVSYADFPGDGTINRFVAQFVVYFPAGTGALRGCVSYVK